MSRLMGAIMHLKDALADLGVNLGEVGLELEGDAWAKVSAEVKRAEDRAKGASLPLPDIKWEDYPEVDVFGLTISQIEPGGPPIDLVFHGHRPDFVVFDEATQITAEQIQQMIRPGGLTWMPARHTVKIMEALVEATQGIPSDNDLDEEHPLLVYDHINGTIRTVDGAPMPEEMQKKFTEGGWLVLDPLNERLAEEKPYANAFDEAIRLVAGSRGNSSSR